MRLARASARRTGADRSRSRNRRGKCGLSEASAKRLAKKLTLSEKETIIFINQVVAAHGRSKVEREKAHAVLESIKDEHSFDEIALDSFRIIADWYHFAILELTEVEGFKSNAAWIAKRLGISRKIAKESIERLFDTGLLAKKDSG